MIKIYICEYVVRYLLQNWITLVSSRLKFIELSGTHYSSLIFKLADCVGA